MAPSATVDTSQSESAVERSELKLPVGIVSTGDARRLRRDIAAMQETIQAIRIRTNAPVAKMPRLSRSLEEFASTNRLNFLLPEDRHQAEIFMDYVLKNAPILHMSFASEASRKFTTELIMWLRANFDSELLVEIGLEPNMAAGCVVRTTNRVFDFSLIQHLAGKRDVLMEMILASPPPKTQPTVPTASAPATFAPVKPQLSPETQPIPANANQSSEIKPPQVVVQQQTVPQLIKSTPSSVAQPSPLPSPEVESTRSDPIEIPAGFVPPPPPKPLGADNE